MLYYCLDGDVVTGCYGADDPGVPASQLSDDDARVVLWKSKIASGNAKNRLSEIDSASIRAMRSIVLAICLGKTPDSTEVDALGAQEAEAKVLRLNVLI